VVAPVLNTSKSQIYKKAPERILNKKSKQEKLFDRLSQQGVASQPEIKTIQK